MISRKIWVTKKSGNFYTVLQYLFWLKVVLGILKSYLLVNGLVNSFKFDISIQIVNWARHILYRHNCTNFVIWLKFNHDCSLLKHFVRHNVEKNWGRWWHKFSDRLVKFFNSENTLTKKSQAEFDFCHTGRRYCNVNVWWAEKNDKINLKICHNWFHVKSLPLTRW